ncbi:energy transducer TonB family protein [Noviherbaspirillum sedimenti]|uniref:TonB family protein n=1 Tax=Noviherbaspirillum sedimenti TaxID=2320865 RepID=A0A3A3G818_9BURK|nr:TonB family protein [Noviherbaspirillum sedimenti]RJG02702.1 TonB family protein [Noviherbaspirillum sedimenti]
MKTRLSLLCAAAIFAGCASDIPGPSAIGGPGRAVTAEAASVHAYKVALANHIAAVNGERMYPGRPQALLRSVVVLKYVVDSDGKLLRSEIMRSNRDRTTEATALATLRNSAPFPRPASHLLQRGRLELSETWLFNNDGRFQLRSTAQQQMDQ